MPQHRRVLWPWHGHVHDHGRQSARAAARSATWAMAAPTRWTRMNRKLAQTIAKMRLKYAVITSVDRDDLRDGGAGHFVECIRRSARCHRAQIDPGADFRGRDERAWASCKRPRPDVMNHNLETAPRLYKEARPGSDYQFSLNLLKKFRRVPRAHQERHHGGPGETDEEVLQVLRDMRAHGIDMLTIGQYLAPSTTTCRCAATCTPTPSRCSNGRPTTWASPTPPWARSCARATTPTFRHRPGV